MTDWMMGCLATVLLLGLVLLLGTGALAAVDGVHYERKAFTATAACEAKRMEARRKFLSAEVICVPAYRGTKADTLTLQGVK